MRSNELIDLHHRAVHAGLARVDADQLENAGPPRVRGLLRELRSRSGRRDVGKFLDDRRTHQAYLRLDRDAQIDVLDAIVRWIEPHEATASSSAPGSELVAWATANGVEDWLKRPARELEGSARTAWDAQVFRYQARELTVREVAEGHLSRHGLKLQSREAAVRAYLERAVREQQSVAARRERWTLPTGHVALDRVSRLLVERELAVAARTAFPTALDALALDSARSALKAYTGTMVPVELGLADHEAGTVSVSPNAQLADQLALYRVALDAIHDPESPLHAPMRAMLTTPAWSRMITAVVAQADAPAPAAPGRIAFAISPGPNRVRDLAGALRPARRAHLPEADPQRVDARPAALARHDRPGRRDHAARRTGL